MPLDSERFKGIPGQDTLEIRSPVDELEFSIQSYLDLDTDSDESFEAKTLLSFSLRCPCAAFRRVCANLSLQFIQLSGIAGSNDGCGDILLLGGQDKCRRADGSELVQAAPPNSGREFLPYHLFREIQLSIG